jgi:Arc/MetJ-type ribon-helix-helix transcriptional regulator
VSDTTRVRRITVEVPSELLDKAQRATGRGISETVRTGLELVAASPAYEKLRQLRGKFRFSRTLAELKDDR